MKRSRWIVLSLVLVAAVAVAQDRLSEFTDFEGSAVQPGRMIPPTAAPGFTQQVGPTTFYTDRPTFQAANPGLPIESFAGTIVAPGGITACTPPLNSATNDACFPAAGVIPGFDLDVTVDSGSGMYVVLNMALGMPCVGVGPNSFVDEADFDFSPAVRGAGFDLYTPLGGGEPFTVEVFGTGGSLASTPVTGGGLTGTFFGVDTTDPGGIIRIEIREGVDSTGEIFCDLEFGGAPIPVEVTGFTIE